MATFFWQINEVEVLFMISNVDIIHNYIKIIIYKRCWSSDVKDVRGLINLGPQP